MRLEKQHLAALANHRSFVYLMFSIILLVNSRMLFMYKESTPQKDESVLESHRAGGRANKQLGPIVSVSSPCYLLLFLLWFLNVTFRFHDNLLSARRKRQTMELCSHLGAPSPQNCITLMDKLGSDLYTTRSSFQKSY